jgi:hypothetical protein
MKDTFTRDEILTIIENAMTGIETESLLTELFNKPFSQDELNEQITNGKLGEAVQKCINDGIALGRAIGMVEMFQKFNAELNKLQ